MNEKYPLALSEGSVLAGQYIIEKVLGQGGFGITYEAKDYKTNERVAVKEFFPDSMATRTNQTTVMPFTGERGDNYEYGKTCFLQEAETLAQFIGNENIVRIHSYFEENGTAYFVMDFIEGISYDEYLKQHGGKVSYEEAAQILFPVMDALSIVHSRGIVHRDVTPDNIYITNEGVVKLLDFGAARYSLGDQSRSLDIILKHGFAPKEQYTRRGKQGPYTDIYSLGATFYFSLTGKRPPDSVERLDEDDLVPPSSLGVQISPAAEDAILQALSVQPGDRFQSMTAFKNALMNVRQSEAVQPPPVSQPVTVQTFAAAPAQTVGQTTWSAPINTPPAGPQTFAGAPVQPDAQIPRSVPMDTPPAGGTAKAKKGLPLPVVGVAAAVLIGIVGFVGYKFFGPGSNDAANSKESTPVQTAPAAPVNTVTPEPFMSLEPIATPDPTDTPEPTKAPSGDLTVLGTSQGNNMNYGIIAGSNPMYLADDSGTSIIPSGGDYIYEKLNGMFMNLSFVDGKLYFLYNESAYTYDPQTGNDPGIAYLNDPFGDDIERLMITEDYYVVGVREHESVGVYRVSRSNGERYKCCTTEASNTFTLSDDGWIYYVAREDELPGIYRMRLDTLDGNQRLLYNKAARAGYSNPIVVGDYLYICLYDSEDLSQYFIQRFDRGKGWLEDDPIWSIGEKLGLKANGEDAFGFNVNVDNYDIYFWILSDEGEYDLTPTLYQMKGYEDGTFNIEKVANAFLPQIRYLKDSDGNYRVYYYRYSEEYGNYHIYYRTFNKNGTQINNN